MTRTDARKMTPGTPIVWLAYGKTPTLGFFESYRRGYVAFTHRVRGRAERFDGLHKAGEIRLPNRGEPVALEVNGEAYPVV